MKGFTPKIVVIVAVLLVLVVAAGVAVWLFFLRAPAPGKVSVAPVGVESVDKTGAGSVEPRFKDVVVVEPFERIMLKPGGNMTSVTLAVSLELVLPGMRQEIEANMASIRTIIETITGETNWSDLRSPEGKLALKLKLIKKINQSLAGQSLARAGIRDLFFTNLIMQ